MATLTDHLPLTPKNDEDDDDDDDVEEYEVSSTWPERCMVYESDEVLRVLERADRLQTKTRMVTIGATGFNYIWLATHALNTSLPVKIYTLAEDAGRHWDRPMDTPEQLACVDCCSFAELAPDVKVDPFLNEVLSAVDAKKMQDVATRRTVEIWKKNVVAARSVGNQAFVVTSSRPYLAPLAFSTLTSDVNLNFTCTAYLLSHPREIAELYIFFASKRKWIQCRLTEDGELDFDPLPSGECPRIRPDADFLALTSETMATDDESDAATAAVYQCVETLRIAMRERTSDVSQ